MNIFDADSDDGLSPVGSIGLVVVLGFGAYVLWQFAYKRGADDVFQLERPGCVITMPGGQVLQPADLKQREHIALPKGATLTGACLNPA